MLNITAANNVSTGTWLSKSTNKTDEKKKEWGWGQAGRWGEAWEKLERDRDNYATKQSIMLTGKSDISKARVGVATTYGQATF